MQIAGHDVAVCSWSLQPSGMKDLVDKVQQLGLQHVQLALGELIALDEEKRRDELRHVYNAGIRFTGGMMAFAGEDYATIDHIRRTGGFAPEDAWVFRKQACFEGVKLARELGMRAVTTHIGFVPPTTDSRYQVIVDRVREIAGEFAKEGIKLLMETGQESATELLHFLGDLNAANVGVNFDPANMILYGAGDPIEAIKVLAPHIWHVHVKDATPSDKPGITWGSEVPFGVGTVGSARFMAALKEIGYVGPLAIEREAGSNRMGDVRSAIESLRSATDTVAAVG